MHSLSLTLTLTLTLTLIPVLIPHPNPNPTQHIQSCRMGETVYHSFSPSMLECDLKQCKEIQIHYSLRIESVRPVANKTLCMACVVTIELLLKENEVESIVVAASDADYEYCYCGLAVAMALLHIPANGTNGERHNQRNQQPVISRNPDKILLRVNWGL